MSGTETGRRLRRLMAVGAFGVFVGGCATAGDPPSDAHSVPDRDQQVSVEDTETVTVPDVPQRDGPLRVALLAPTSGPLADVGGQLVDAVMLAYYDAPTSGEVDVTIYDTGGNADGAADAARQAVAEETDVILGPLLAESVRAAAPIARDAGLDVLAFSNDTRLAGGNVYLAGVAVEQEAARMLDWLIEQDRESILLFAPDNDYSRRVIGTVENHQGPLDIRTVSYAQNAPASDIRERIAAETRYEIRREAMERLKRRVRDALASDDPSRALETVAEAEAGSGSRTRDEHAALLDDVVFYYKQLVREGISQDDAITAVETRLDRHGAVSGLEFDVVMLPMGGEQLSIVASMMESHGVAAPVTRLVGTGLWSFDEPWRESALRGGWYAAYAANARDDVSTRLEEVRQGQSETVALLAYDTMAFVMAGVDDVPGRMPSIRDLAATSENSDAGISFGDEQVARWPIAVFEVRAEGAEMVGDPVVLPTPVEPDVPVS